jgi:hypothetical protein
VGGVFGELESGVAGFGASGFPGPRPLRCCHLPRSDLVAPPVERSAVCVELVVAGAAEGALGGALTTRAPSGVVAVLPGLVFGPVVVRADSPAVPVSAAAFSGAAFSGAGGAGSVDVASSADAVSAAPAAATADSPAGAAGGVASPTAWASATSGADVATVTASAGGTGST